MFQLARSYLPLADAVSSFSFLKQPCQKTYLVVVERMLNSFKKGQIIGLRQAKKTKRRRKKKIAETIKSC